MTDQQYGPSTPPPYGPYRGGPPRNQLRRSTANRRIAGVAGGLAEYLGVEATAIRLGFVLLSVVFLAGFGGVVLYVLAWALVPEDVDRGWGRSGPGRAWQPQSQSGAGPSWASGPAGTATQWGQPSAPLAPPADRAARSWALVLGAIALALIWSFGLAPWWRSGAPLGWLMFVGILTWLCLGYFRRCTRRGVSGSAGAPASPRPGGPPAGAGPAQAPMASAEPGAASAGPGRPASGSGSGAAAEQGGLAMPGRVITTEPGAPAAPSPQSQEAADWAAAQAAAATWAQQQLEVAGVPPAPPPLRPTDLENAAYGMPGRALGERHRRPRLGALVALLVAGFVLLVVVSVIGITLGSGASLVGGVGNVTDRPDAGSALSPHYELGLGRLEVDLSKVRFGTGGRTVDASVGAGQLVLVLPRHTIVNLDAKVGVGKVHLPSGNAGRLAQLQLANPPSTSAEPGPVPRLSVDANVGLGVIDVRWG